MSTMSLTVTWVIWTLKILRLASSSPHRLLRCVEHNARAFPFLRASQKGVKRKAAKRQPWRLFLETLSLDIAFHRR